MTIRRAGKPVDHLIQRAVAAARDDQIPALAGGPLRHLCRVARAFRLDELYFNSHRRKNPARFVQRAAALRASMPGIGIMNQESILKPGSHSIGEVRVRLSVHSFYIM